MNFALHSSITFSPSWYCANALDALEWNHDEKSGIFFYASRNSMYFIKLSEIVDDVKLTNDINNSNIKFSFRLCFFMKAHLDCVVGVCSIKHRTLLPFEKEMKLARIVSCGKDKLIRLWSFEEETGCCCLKEFNVGNTKLNTTVTCITVNDSNTVVCGFEKGFILSWNYANENEFKTFSTESENIVQIECNAEKLAIAYKKGIICIYAMPRYDSLIKITRIRAHNSDICSVSWNPVSNLIDSWGDLAIVGKDHRVSLWRVNKNLNIKSLKLPNVSRKIISDKDSSSSWSSLCWSAINSGTLIVSNSQGNLGLWKTLDSEELKYFPQNPQFKIHTKAVFSIKEFPNYRGLLISHSYDRSINVTRVTETGVCLGCVLTIPGLGGSACSLAAVEHSNLLAVGCGDNILRLWRQDSNDVINIWDGIYGKVLSVCWHPSVEGLLAFGTEDGKVGLVNVNKDKKIAITSQLHHKGKVFVVAWATDMRSKVSDGEDAERLIVYSVGDYSLFGHDFRREHYFDASSYVDDSKDKTKITDFRVHSSLKYFSVGYSNGVVNAFSAITPISRLCSIKVHFKSINCMSWKGHKLAIGSNERFLSVSDLSSVLQVGSGNDKLSELTETMAVLKGHGDRITCVDWSPVDDDRLVSASYDGTAFVWSISGNCPLVSFNLHQGKVACCYWSRRDPDVIYTGADDCNLFAWRISKQTLQTTLNKRKQTVIIPGIEPPAVLEEKSIQKDKITNSVKEETDMTGIERKAFIKKRTSLFPTTLFSVHHPLEEQQLSMIKFIDKEPGYLPFLDLFSPRSLMVRQIEVELKHYLVDKNYENYFLILVWMGKIGLVLEEFVSLNYTPFWLSSLILEFRTKDVPDRCLAAMVSNTVNNRKDPLLAATFMLGDYQTAEAIDLLTAENCVREAFVLAKLRLSPDDALVRTLLTRLQSIYLKSGGYELSAMCSLSLGDYEQFAETMHRRASPLSSWVVLKALSAAGEEATGLLEACAMTFVGGLLQGASAGQWLGRVRAEGRLAHYSMLADVHGALWGEEGSLAGAVAAVRSGWASFGAEKVERLVALVRARLALRQVNQVEAQMRLYATYELVVVVDETLRGGDGPKPSIEGLREAFRLVTAINPQTDIIKREAAAVMTDDDAVEGLRLQLTEMKIEDSIGTPNVI